MSMLFKLGRRGCGAIVASRELLCTAAAASTQQGILLVRDLCTTSKDDVFLPPGSASASGLRRLAWSNIFVGTTSTPAQVSHVEFVKSSVHAHDCPKDDLPEFAFVGRSNVGKSSLINALVRRKIAKTSKTPGKTQVINHFSIDKSWYLVDLPGYGFARAPTDVRVTWDNFTKDYFLKRETLVSVLLLIDASVPPKKSDLGYANWLASNKASGWNVIV